MSQAKETQPLFPDAESFIGATLPCGATVVRALGAYGNRYSVNFDRDPVTTRGERSSNFARCFDGDGHHQPASKNDRLPDLTPALARQRFTLAGLTERWPSVARFGYHTNHPLVGRKLTCGAEIIAVSTHVANPGCVWVAFDRLPAGHKTLWGHHQFDLDGRCRRHPELILLPAEKPAAPDIDTRIAGLEAQVAALKAAREAERRERETPAELRAAREHVASFLRARGANNAASRVSAGQLDDGPRLQGFLAGVEWARNTPKTA